MSPWLLGICGFLTIGGAAVMADDPVREKLGDFPFREELKSELIPELDLSYQGRVDFLRREEPGPPSETPWDLRIQGRGLGTVRYSTDAFELGLAKLEDTILIFSTSCREVKEVKRGDKEFLKFQFKVTVTCTRPLDLDMDRIFPDEDLGIMAVGSQPVTVLLDRTYPVPEAVATRAKQPAQPLAAADILATSADPVGKTQLISKPAAAKPPTVNPKPSDPGDVTVPATQPKTTVRPAPVRPATPPKPSGTDTLEEAVSVDKAVGLPAEH